MNSITTLPIPDSTVSPLQWGTNPDPSDQNSGRVFLTVDPETGYTHIWSWDRNEWLQLRLTAGEDLDPAAENQQLRSELEALKTALAFEKREVAHWKANHANRVEAARVLIERPDMPLERVDAYRKYLRALQVAQDIIEQGKGRPLPGMEVIERLIGDPKREALLAEAVDLLKWMNDNGRLLCDGSIRWRAQEVIKTYEG